MTVSDEINWGLGAAVDRGSRYDHPFYGDRSSCWVMEAPRLGGTRLNLVLD